MDTPQPTGAAPAPADVPADPAVTFLTGLLPQGELARKRVFNALLRAVLAEGQAKR